VIQIPPNKPDVLNFVAGLGFRLYPWQKNALSHLQLGHSVALVAANGSGKTSTILVPFALWVLHCWPSARVILTSASWAQIEKQAFSLLRQYQDHPVFRGLIFLDTEVRSPAGGFITGLSTDNAGRAEGFHERPDSPVALLVDEAKSVPDLVFSAFDRYTTSFKCYMSSAGGATGVFYSCFTTKRDFWHTVVVRSSDCPHIDPELIDRERREHGESSPFFRSKHLAEFVDDDNENFIPAEAVRLAIDSPPKFEEGPSGTFVDWAGTGGDEIVVGRREGNCCSIIAAFRGASDTQQIVRRVAAILRERSIFTLCADAGGLGAPMNDSLRELGFTVRGVHNGSPAIGPDSNKFANLAAAQWYTFRCLLVQGKLILPSDGKLVEQLCGRRLRFDTKGRIGLEPKEIMRARGLPSPDRADACVGASAAMISILSSEQFYNSTQALLARSRRNRLFPDSFIRF
jgi:hypothetical protein